MIRFFKTIQPAALFSIPILCIILWFPGFFKQDAGLIAFDSLLLNGILNIPVFLQMIISMVLVVLGAVYLNHVSVKHEVIYRHSYLPALFYVVLMSFHRDVIQFHPLLVSNLVIIATLDKTFSLFKNENPVSFVFDSSFLLAAATLIYFPSFILFFLLLYSIYSLRSFSFREFLIAIIGYALPFFFVAVYGYWTGTLNASMQNFLARFSIHKIDEGLVTGRQLMGYSIFLALLILLSLVRLRSNFYRNAIKARSTQEILFLFFLLTGLGLL